jgi:hypothetical protein
MSSATFSTLSPGDVRRELYVARITPNAVSLRLRQMLSGRMVRVCGWCEKFMGTAPCTPGMHGKITHGICPSCREKHFGAVVEGGSANREVAESSVRGSDGGADSTAGDAKHQCMKSLRAEPAACERKQAGILTDQLLPNTGA